MNPATFPQVNTTFGEDQPEFLLVPGHVHEGITTVCYELDEAELIALVRSRRVWIQMITGTPAIIPPMRVLAVDPLPP